MGELVWLLFTFGFPKDNPKPVLFNTYVECIEAAKELPVGLIGVCVEGTAIMGAGDGE